MNTSPPTIKWLFIDYMNKTFGTEFKTANWKDKFSYNNIKEAFKVGYGLGKKRTKEQIEKRIRDL